MKKLKAVILAAFLTAVAFPFIPMTYTLEVGDFPPEDTYTSKYNRFILNLADSNDTVLINIDSMGGRVLPALKLMNTIARCEARTISNNTNLAVSAGAFVAMTTDAMMASEHSSYLFHKPYYVNEKGERVTVADDQLLASSLQRLMETRVFQYFTEKERQAYSEGKDVIINGPELIKRIRNGTAN